MHITCALAHEAKSTYISTQDITIELPVTEGSIPTTTVAATATATTTTTAATTATTVATNDPAVGTQPAVEPESLPLYAMVLVLTTLTILVSVCSVTIVLFIYTARQRWILKQEKKKDEKREREEQASQEAKKETEDKPDKPVHHYRRSRRSKLYQNRSTLQTLLHKVSELPAVEDKSNRTRNHSSLTADNKSDSSSNNTSSSSQKTRALVAMVRPISCTPPGSDLLKLGIQKKTTTTSQSTKPSSNNKKGLSAGWYDRYQMRQKSLEAYAQLYLAAGANTPEPGAAATTTL